jgi:hypothetical protein
VERHEDEDEGEAAGRAAEAGHPLSVKPLSSVTSLEESGESSSLTSFLARPVPRTKTPLPAEAAPVPTEAAPVPTEAAPVPEPPDPVVRAEATEDHVRALPPRSSVPRILAIVGALLAGGVVWLVVSSSSHDGPAEMATESDTQPDTQMATESESATGTATGTGVGTVTGADTDTALAVLPVTPPEILSQNTWVRRNRAAEIRSEARLLHGMGRWQEAQATLLLSLQWDPSNTDAMRNVSRTFQQLHEMEHALAWSRRAVVTDPMDPRSHELVGDQLLMIGHELEAAEAYRAGLESAPSDLRLRTRLRRLSDAP